MKARRLWLWLPWTAFAALAAGWTLYWHMLADQAQSRLAAWVNEQNGQVSIARVTLHGFPVLMRLEIHGLAYAPARGGWRVNTERLDLHVQMLNPAHLKFEAKAPIAITRDNGAITNVTADALVASWRSARGALAVAGVEADHLSLDDPAQDGVLAVGKLVINVRPDPRAAGEYQIAFDAEALTLARPVRSFESFGLDIASLRAAIVAEHGAALLEDSIARWSEAGGRLRFEALTLNWGPLVASGTGAGGLDSARRLQGVLELPIERPGPVFAALANGPEIDQNARRALGLLAAGYALSGDIKLDVEARDGVLRLEGLAVRTLPPVY